MKLSYMLLVAGLAAALVPGAHAAGATVIQVIDGDTIVAQLDETGSAEVIRLLGVDAPEEYRPERPKFKWAQLARQALANVILRKRVRLEFNPEAERDRFGRMLAYIHTEAGADVNGSMIARGLGLHFERYTHPRFEEYRRLQEEAEAHKRGVFKKPRKNLSVRATTANWATPTSGSPGAGAPSSPTTEGGATSEKKPKKVRFFVSLTKKIHRDDCENRYVQRDMKAKQGKFHDSYRAADVEGTSNCKVCRPYLKR
jgi:endonuclease YncB( thermonuclease family)